MKKQKRYLVFVLAATFLFPTLLGAQHENLWRGGKTGRNADWHIAANWSKHRVPAESDNVVIPATGVNPYITGNVTVRSLYIEPGAEVVLRDRAMLVILRSNLYSKDDITETQPITKDLQLDVNQNGELVAYQSNISH